MKKAIALPYCVDQHEPSRPIKQIISLPDDVEQRDELLKMLFLTHVCELDIEETHEIEINDGTKGAYGDLVVSYGDDLYLYITFIEE